MIMLRRSKDAIFLIPPSLRRSNSLVQLSCEAEREGARLQCSLDLQLDIQTYSSTRRREEREGGVTLGLGSLGATIVIIPGHLQGHLQSNKSREKNCVKKTRFLDYEDEEFSSEVGRFT